MCTVRIEAKRDVCTVFAVITGLFGLFCFIHYSRRSFKLFWKKTSPRYRPLGWTRPRWAVVSWSVALCPTSLLSTNTYVSYLQLEFFHLNIALVVSLFETELVIGTSPTNPILRLCAMPAATICFYFGFVFLLSSTFTAFKYCLPFNMSSTPKGSLWRPVLYAFIEDFGAVDMHGEQAFRMAMMQRYETSFMFRRMIQTLSWCWGIGFLVTATIATVLIMILPVMVGFGVGWVTPFVCAAVMAALSVVYVKRSLREERAAWSKDHNSGSSIIEMGVHGS